MKTPYFYMLVAALVIIAAVALERVIWPDIPEVVVSPYQVQETGDVLEVPADYQPKFHISQCFVHNDWKIHEPSPAGLIAGILENQVYIVLLAVEANQAKRVKGGHYVLAWSFDQKYKAIPCPVVWQSTAGKKPWHRGKE